MIYYEYISQFIAEFFCKFEDTSKPYRDNKISETSWIRTFDPIATDSDDYIWHRDEKDRIITIIDGEGWKFQFDNEMPIRINRNDIIKIPSQIYHRIIVGTTPLKIKIEEVDQ